MYINQCEIGYELPDDIKIEERGVTLMHILKLTLVCTDLDLAQKIRIKSLQLFL